MATCKAIIRKLKKLYDWLPVIWQDEDWDYACLLKLMSFKLTRMRLLQEREGHGTHHLDVAKQILEAEIMIRNIVEDDPDDEWSSHYWQWCSHKDINEECGSPEEHRRDLDLSAAREERNWSALWAHLDKYMRGFWD